MGHEVIVLKKESTPHECVLPKQGSLYHWRHEHVAYPAGTIIACTECGTYYYLILRYADVTGETHGEWHKVRWYHFGKKREIEGR